LPQFATRGVLSVANTAYRRLVERSGLVRYSGDECLRRLRELCVALSGVSERVSHGEPSWFVKKQFVTLADHHHDDRFGFWAAAPQGAQERWIALDDGRFFRPPYVGGRGWIGVYLDVEQDWDDIAEIVGDAHAVVAPKRGGR
jgi:hypothetical protein